MVHHNRINVGMSRIRRQLSGGLVGMRAFMGPSAGTLDHSLENEGPICCAHGSKKLQQNVFRKGLNNVGRVSVKAAAGVSTGSYGNRPIGRNVAYVVFRDPSVPSGPRGAWSTFIGARSPGMSLVRDNSSSWTVIKAGIAWGKDPFRNPGRDSSKGSIFRILVSIKGRSNLHTR